MGDIRQTNVRSHESIVKRKIGDKFKNMFRDQNPKSPIKLLKTRF